MKMPDTIENIMFAPCGINCAVCYKRVGTRKEVSRVRVVLNATWESLSIAANVISKVACKKKVIPIVMNVLIFLASS